MSDIFSKKKRSEIMSKIRSKNTKPEMAVRSILYGLGFRFRLHDRSLPGTPDVVIRKLKTVVDVRGCFWHMHLGCKPRRKFPKTNRRFWSLKLRGNVRRDRANEVKMSSMGWRTVVVWECELKDKDSLRLKLAEELGRCG
jgi:DNA mismatch endonuclease (patch repair protein)